MNLGLRVNLCSSFPSLALSSKALSFPSSSSLYIGNKNLRPNSDINLNLRPNSEINLNLRPDSDSKRRAKSIILAITDSSRVPELDSSSEPIQVFNGTTRLYISYTCPFAQRAWIARNYKGLKDKIELVPIDLKNRPAWYKEQVYAANKVPALEHNNRVIGESLDLIKYIDTNFEGPSLTPDGVDKLAFAEELLLYTDSFSKAVRSTLNGTDSNAAGVAFDYIEQALSKFKEGSFFLGQFSLVDVAYAPFIERFRLILKDIVNVDVTSGRPNLALWVQEMNKIEAYNETRQDPQDLVERYKKRLQAEQRL